MIPYKDENPTRTFPFVTLTLIALNLAAFIWQLLDPQGWPGYASVPAQLHEVLPKHTLWPLVTLWTSTFLHGGFVHIFFNLLFLWVFGNNVEDRLGHGRFLAFYLLGALIASLSQVIVAPHSTVPIIGASGAISAVLGAYMVFFPSARVKTLFIIVVIPVVFVLPAALVLGLWFAGQIMSSLFVGSEGGGVAWYAHIGGFLFGFLVAITRRRAR